jgi:hypothetical protein
VKVPYAKIDNASQSLESRNLPKSPRESGLNDFQSSISRAEGTMELLAAGAAGGATVAIACGNPWHVALQRQQDTVSDTAGIR